MIYFSSLPAARSSVGGPLPVTLAGITGQTARLALYDENNVLLGTKRIVGQSEATVDVAPMLRGIKCDPPAVGKTGLFAASERMVRLRFEAESDGVLITSPYTYFFLSNEAVEAPCCCTHLKRARLLAAGEWDELTLLTDAPLTITVTAEYRDRSETEQFQSPMSGLYLFRVAADDYPEALMLTVDAGDFGLFHYTPVEAIEGTVRLAWRNTLGGVEHYTFPIVSAAKVTVRKERARDAEGLRTIAAEREEVWQLQSAYETALMMGTLTELLSATEVWRLTEAGYERVEVLSEQAEIEPCGLLQQLTLQIRSAQKGGLLWS